MDDPAITAGHGRIARRAKNLHWRKWMIHTGRRLGDKAKDIAGVRAVYRLAFGRRRVPKEIDVLRMGVRHRLAVLMSSRMSIEALTSFQRPGSASKKQEKATDDSTESFHSK